MGFRTNRQPAVSRRLHSGNRSSPHKSGGAENLGLSARACAVLCKKISRPKWTVWRAENAQNSSRWRVLARHDHTVAATPTFPAPMHTRGLNNGNGKSGKSAENGRNRVNRPSAGNVPSEAARMPPVASQRPFWPDMPRSVETQNWRFQGPYNRNRPTLRGHANKHTEVHIRTDERIIPQWPVTVLASPFRRLKSMNVRLCFSACVRLV